MDTNVNYFYLEMSPLQLDRHKPNDGAGRIVVDLFSQNKKVIYLEVSHLQPDRHQPNGADRIVLDLFSVLSEEKGDIHGTGPLATG